MIIYKCAYCGYIEEGWYKGIEKSCPTCNGDMEVFIVYTQAELDKAVDEGKAEAFRAAQSVVDDYSDSLPDCLPNIYRDINTMIDQLRNDQNNREEK